MSKNKKCKTRIKKAFVFEGPVKSFNVMETLFPELWGKCSFRIRRRYFLPNDSSPFRRSIAKSESLYEMERDNSVFVS